MDTFEKISWIKGRVKELAERSLKEGIILDEEFHQITTGIEKEKVKIGVVGQIKHGKSTLLNALLFGKPFLPMATTPMTASLSYIAYGKGDIEVEFFTEEDWRDIEELARSKGESDEIKAAQELVEKAKRIKDIKNYFGQKKVIKFSEIKDYVGEGGIYVPITTALTIKHPDEKLKEVDFVDTPGFNDPIISREHRSQQFLSEADVVIFLLYAGRPFDENDKKLLFNRVGEAGAGKIVVIMNKKDTVWSDEGDEEKAKSYIEEKFREGVREIEKENPIIATIFNSTRIIPFSSLWALFGKMDERDINTDEDLKYHYMRFKEEFPQLKSKEDFFKYSGLSELEDEIENILKKEKFNILIRKPITFIIGKWKNKDNKLREELYGLEVEEKSLNRELGDIRKEIGNIKEVEKEVEKYISDNTYKLRADVKKMKKEIRNNINGKLYDIRSNIDFEDKDWFECHSTYSQKCNTKFNQLMTKTTKEFKDDANKKEDEITNNLKEFVKNLDEQITVTASKYLTYTIDDINKFKDTYLKSIDEKIEFDLSNVNVGIETSGWWFFGTAKAREEAKRQTMEYIDKIMKDDVFMKMVDKYFQKIEGIISEIQEEFGKKVINPIQNNLKKAEKNYEDRAKRLNEIDSEKKKLGKKIKNTENEINNIENEMKKLLGE